MSKQAKGWVWARACDHFYSLVLCACFFSRYLLHTHVLHQTCNRMKEFCSIVCVCAWTCVCVCICIFVGRQQYINILFWFFFLSLFPYSTVNVFFSLFINLLDWFSVRKTVKLLHHISIHVLSFGVIFFFSELNLQSKNSMCIAVHTNWLA